MLTLKTQDQLKLDVIRRVYQSKISFNQALKILNVSERTLFRYLSKYSDQGLSFVLHKNLNKAPKNKINPAIESKIINLCKEKYFDFNRTHAREKLFENHQLKIKKSTFNDLCNRHNILNKNKKRRKKIARTRRPRMKQTGLMIQMDGSPHRWFGHRKTCLVIAIDDATSEILYGEFSPTETTFACMNVVKKVLKDRGIFQILYVDKAGIFGKDPIQQFDALKREGFSSLRHCLLKFNIHTIFAHSPEAKGRVERAFKTLQDRVPPEMRLAKIKNISEANKHFNDVLLPRLKELFANNVLSIESAFIPILPSVSLDEEFYMLEKRQIKNDHTFSFKNVIHDLKIGKGRNYSGKQVEIRSYPDGKVSYFVDDEELSLKVAKTMIG